MEKQGIVVSDKWIEKEAGDFGLYYNLCPKCMKQVIDETERFFGQFGKKLSESPY